MAKRPKLSYIALTEPQPGLLRPPPEKLTRKAESIQLANQLKVGIKQTAIVFADDTSVSDALSDLRRGLIDLVTTSDAERSNALAADIKEFTLLGYAAGFAETDGGIAEAGRTEGHLAFALTLLSVEAWTEKGRDNGRLALMDYSLQSGYVRFRSGPASVSRLLSTARDHRSALVLG